MEDQGIATGRSACVTLLILILVLLPSAAPAQKAEPLRIEFDPGSNVATVHGRLRNRQLTQYAVYSGGQLELVLKLRSANAKSLALRLQDPFGEEITLNPAGPYRWVARLRHEGDYEIEVRRIRRKRGVSTYDLTLTVNTTSK